VRAKCNPAKIRNPTVRPMRRIAFVSPATKISEIRVSGSPVAPDYFEGKASGWSDTLEKVDRGAGARRQTGGAALACRRLTQPFAVDREWARSFYRSRCIALTTALLCAEARHIVEEPWLTGMPMELPIS